MIENQQPNPQGEKADSVVPPEPITPPRDSNTDKPTSCTEKPKTPKQPLWEKRLRSWLMIGFTGALALYSAWLYSVAVEQANNSKKSSEAALRGVAVAESSIAVSKSIAKNQERFAKIQNRAYIVFSEILENNIKVGDSIHIVIGMKNTGNTPANSVSFRGIIKLGTGIYKDDIRELERGHWERDRNPYSIGPGLTATQVVDFRVLTPTDSIFLARGTYSIFCVGRFIYTDFFSDMDTTRFCIKYDKRSNSFRIVTEYNAIR